MKLTGIATDTPTQSRESIRICGFQPDHIEGPDSVEFSDIEGFWIVGSDH